MIEDSFKLTEPFESSQSGLNKLNTQLIGTHPRLGNSQAISKYPKYTLIETGDRTALSIVL